MKLYLKLALSGIIVLGTLSTVITAEDYSTHRLTGPSELLTPSPANNENNRFSRLLQDKAGVLQFSSISNLAPRLSGLKKDTKESKPDKRRGSLKISERNLGRRTLDYDSSEGFNSHGEPYPRIITEPQAGNEYVYIRHGGVQAGEQQFFGAGDNVAAINRKPTKSAVPLTLLRQTNGKRINITPVFSQEQQDSGFSTHTPLIIDSLTTGQIQEHVKGLSHGETTESAPNVQGDEDVEATTFSSFSQRLMEDEEQKETNNGEDKMVVNVVTSVPRFEIGGVPSASNYSAAPSPPGIETIHPTVAHDLKENLVVQSSRRVGSFPDFEDSPTRLLTSETSQPARVNVRPASSGKEYEYEYIYYYYDDEDEDNSTSKGNRSVNGSAKGTASGIAPQTILGSSPAATPSKASLLDNDFDDEEEIEEIEDQQPVSKQNVVPSAKDSPKSSVATPTKISNDKFASNGPINQLIRTREPKQVAQVEKANAPNVDYKIESGNFDQYEEGEEVQTKAKGQPQRPPAFEDEEDDEAEIEQPQDITAAKGSTSAPITSTVGLHHGMSTMTKSHPDSINSPIILKQSSILQSVPASQLNQEYEYSEEVHATSPLTTTSTTTTTTTTTTTEAPQVAVTTPRSSFSRNRGQQRVRGNTPSSTAPTVTESSQPKAPTKNRDSFRRTPARKVESSPSTPTETSASEQSVQNVPVPTRALPSRTRFAPRTSSIPPQILETSPEVHLTTEQPLVVSPTSQDDYAAKESYVKNKAANDLFTFTRLQQAISSRSPSPARKELFANRPLKINQNSNEFGNTESAVSSEATTVVGIVEASREMVHLPSTTTTTTTTTAATTTSEATSKFGGQRTRFSRPRKPAGADPTASSVATVQEESASVTPRIPSRNRFSGRRTTSAPAPSDTESVTPSTASPSSEPARTRGPTRNRFASRTRPTTEPSSSVTPSEEIKESNTTETVKTTPPISRRKPIFQGRRRNPIVAGQAANNATTKEQEPTEAISQSPVVESIKTTVTASATEDEQIPKDAENKRPGPVIGGLKRRPGVGPRLRGGRLGASTTTTVEPIVVVVEKHEDSPSESDQIPTSQSEQLETAAVPNSVPVKEEPTTGQRGNSGVVGRLRTRPRPLATTTTVAPEPTPKVQKASRLNGILNRRKVGGPLGVTTPSKEETKPEAAPEEEANNNAKEQQDLLNKGVVVEVSSSITESEEVKAEHGEEQVDASSTTAASILNRLKSQRKPGSIFRKRTDPHGE